jgi:hypothetical protein
MARKKKKDLNTLRTRAGQLKRLRAGMLRILFATKAPSTNVPALDALNDLANSFSRFAAYQQTAFDSGAARSSSSNEASAMRQLVQGAINKVLGQGTASGKSFFNALNSTFPAILTSEGQQVISTPARSVVSLSRPGMNGYGAIVPAGYDGGSYVLNAYGSSVGQADGYAGTISARQANLYRQATVIVGDATQVLNGLMPFAPEAESDQVESLRALIRSEMNVLVEEFGRVDEPRKERVLAYFSALKIHLAGFGERAFLNDPNLPVTVDDEAQVTGFELLKSYVRILQEAWGIFFGGDRAPDSFSLSERVERANVLLPVVAQVDFDFGAAMDSVGFTESERRSRAAAFNTLAGYDIQSLPVSSLRSLIIRPQSAQIAIDASLPDITVYDLTEWIERFAGMEGPNNLVDSGQYGLDFVTDQADQIFWVVAAVLARLDLSDSGTAPSASPPLEQILSNERVRFALNNLLGQLNSLADLSVAGGNENLLNP